MASSLSLSGSSDPSAGRLQSEGVRNGSRRQKDREVDINMHH